jgi:type I restriction enzyme S subunit
MQGFSGGSKFRNGDTIMARITPCLENGKVAKVNILDDGEVGFGSTEYIVFRAKEGITDADFLYYLVSSPLVREPSIKSMVGSSGRQRVQTDVVQRLKIALPSLHEQHKIAEILKILDDKIELNNEINNNFTPATSRAKPRRHRPLGARSQMGVWRCGFIGRQPDSEQLCCERGAAA